MNLTICIPTFNRCVFLRNLLQILIKEIKDSSLQSQIEILVSNNNSTDETLSVLTDLQNTFDDVNIKIINNRENLGVIRNIINCISNSSSEFWWFLGDDDSIVEGSLKDILNHLKVFKHIPVHVFNQKCNKPIKKNSAISINHAICNYFYYVGNAVTIANTKLSKQILKDELNEAISTCWPQTYIYFRIAYLSNLQKPIYISELSIFSQQERIINNISNAFYHFDSQILSLFKLGYLIENRIPKYKKSILNEFPKGIPFVRFPKIIFFSFKLEFMNRFSDLEYEREDFYKAIEESKTVLKGNHKLFLKIILIYQILPDNFFLFIQIFKRVFYSIFYDLLKNFSIKNPLIIINEEKERIKNLKSIKVENLKSKHAHRILRGGW